MKLLFALVIFMITPCAMAQVNFQGPIQLGVSGTTFFEVDDTTGFLELVEPVKAGSSSAATATTCTAGEEGSMRVLEGTLEVCDGADWLAGGVFSSQGVSLTNTTGVGYMVLTSTTYNGNLGDLAGANASCLTDLTTYDWSGKTDAQTRSLLNGTKVRAFLCDRTSCQDGQASTTYAFAVSGDSSKGGATFTTDGSGLAPNNSANWAGSNYFGEDIFYWSGRGSTSITLWGGSTNQSFSTCNSDWNASVSNTGRVGMTNSIDEGRWDGENFDCTQELPLVCFVDP